MLPEIEPVPSSKPSEPLSGQLERLIESQQHLTESISRLADSNMALVHAMGDEGKEDPETVSYLDGSRCA